VPHDGDIDDENAELSSRQMLDALDTACGIRPPAPIEMQAEVPR
jgi:hypothetical protein